jgi:hypothetical protein
MFFLFAQRTLPFVRVKSPKKGLRAIPQRAGLRARRVASAQVTVLQVSGRPDDYSCLCG